MKYVDTEVVFREIPDEITLAISISGCKIHCPDCHSKYLWDDVGTELTNDEIDELIQKHKGITCVCFMGGEEEDLYYALNYIKCNYPNLHLGWYTGGGFPKDNLSALLDYIKIGPYIAERGGLDNPNTNQQFYAKGKVLHKMSAYENSFYDVTNNHTSKTY